MDRAALGEACFPRIRDGITFHLTPSECIAFSPSGRGDAIAGEGSVGVDSRPLSGPVRTAGLAPMDIVNLDAFDVLSLCDGTRSQAEIIRDLRLSAGRTASDGSFRTRAVIAFLEDAHKRHHIDCFPTPQKRPSRPAITGSTGIFLPIHISLELTRRCNLRCSYCYTAAGPGSDRDELSGSRIMDILSAWIDHGLRGIEITGGEPLLHEHFWPILDYCLEKFPSVALLSNGTLFDRKSIDRCAEHRDRLLISVSLDGPNPKIHDRVRGIPGAFGRALSNVRSMIGRGLRTRIAMTVTPDNWREIESTLLLAKDIGATWFGWSPAMPFGRGCGVEWDLTADEVDELSKKELELVTSHRGFVPAIPKIADYMPPSWNCGIGWKNVVVGPSGLVRPCLLLPEADYAIADLKIESIREAFDKEVIFKLRELPSPSDDLCGECSLRIYCTTCPVRAMNRKGQSGLECSWAKASSAGEVMDSIRALARTYVEHRH